MMTKRAVALVLAAAVVVLATGCGDDEPTEEEATAELCAAKADLSARVQGATDVELADLSVDSLEEAVDSVGDEIGELGDAAEQVIADRWKEVEDALDGLRSAIGDLDSDEPLQESVAGVTAAAGDLRTAVDAAFSELGC
jgi:hypothetical protein